LPPPPDFRWQGDGNFPNSKATPSHGVTTCPAERARVTHYSGSRTPRIPCTIKAPDIVSNSCRRSQHNNENLHSWIFNDSER
ncbi:hypothetical protein, partial [Streptomyces calidiresistens]|uniref:hypothetical protein n=1 Tax=Streptomyces calidiresistens TaxID=1485586 RepID=UPI001E45C7F7